MRSATIERVPIERVQGLVILLMAVVLAAVILYREWPQTVEDLRQEALLSHIEEAPEIEKEPVIEQPPADSGSFQEAVRIILPPPPVSPVDQDIPPSLSKEVPKEAPEETSKAQEPPQPKAPPKNIAQPKEPTQQAAKSAPEKTTPSPKPVSIKPLTPLASPEPASTKPDLTTAARQPLHEIEPLTAPKPQPQKEQPQEEIAQPVNEEPVTLAALEPVETSPEPQPAPPQEIYEEAEPPQKIKAKEIPVKEIQAKGRPLLRLMEYGQGSAVNIAWPANSNAMTRLYDELNRCYGMESLVIHQGRLYNRAGLFEPNQDRYSSFMREVQGQIPPRESEFLRKIPVSGAPVRLFPRRVDAMLLGGLHHLLGQEAMEGHHISGTYSLSQNRLLVTDLRLDGVQVEGSVDLTAIRRCT